MFQIAISKSSLEYDDLPCNTFTDGFKKAKLVAGFTQKTLAQKTGLGRSTINEIEAGYRNTVTLETLNKLLTVLDKNILCDDYHIYILDQKENINKLLEKHGMSKLCALLKTHHSTIYRWINSTYQITRKKFEIIKKIDHD